MVGTFTPVPFELLWTSQEKYGKPLTIPISSQQNQCSFSHGKEWLSFKFRLEWWRERYFCITYLFPVTLVNKVFMKWFDAENIFDADYILIASNFAIRRSKIMFQNSGFKSEWECWGWSMSVGSVNKGQLCLSHYQYSHQVLGQSDEWFDGQSWWEHHRYCWITLNIMPLGWLSAIQCNWLRWSNWDLTTDLTSPCVCTATKMIIIKHPYQSHPYEMNGDCPESNQLHFIIM